MVDTNVARILQERTTECSDPVGIDERIDVGVRRQSGVVEEKLRHRTAPGRIDYILYSIIRKRLARPVALRSERIVQRETAALRVNQPAEVTVPQLRRGNRRARRRIGEEAGLLPVPEEERAVAAVVESGNNHRPT